ncbi:hypothetical protein NUM3379_32470 [Kineococcus sp. NUM-3379]
MREQLGAHALGGLPDELLPPLLAHLETCADCRAELADLRELAGDLRLADPAAVEAPPQPPADLGARITAAVRREAELRDRRERRDAVPARRSRVRALLAPLASAAAAAVLTALVLQPDAAPPPKAPVPVEQLTVRSAAAGLSGLEAELIPHTWGVEVTLVATGFEQGGAYRGVVRARDGRTLPAGEFLGTGDKRIVCNMQAALLRADAVGFAVVDSTGTPVVDVELPPLRG